ncbi:Acidic endochitinase [Nymphaea thermarum]|nr:Acidic endochitinase [Nymphaea thermarum]
MLASPFQFLLVFCPLIFLAARTHGGEIGIYWGFPESNTTLTTLNNTCNTRNFKVVSIAALSNFGNGTAPREDFGSSCNVVTGGCKHPQHDIEHCQRMGIKVLLCVGGPTQKYTLADADEAHSLATYVYGVYLSGSGVDGPLGRVKLDGVDFYLRDNVSRTLETNIEAMAKFLKGYDEDILLSASMRCDYILGNHLRRALERGLLDKVWPRFYDHTCKYNASQKEPFVSSVKTWRASLNASFYLGLPTRPDYPGRSGYIPPEQLKDALEIPEHSCKYAGVMLWNSHWDVKNDNYSTRIKPIVEATPDKPCTAPSCHQTRRDGLLFSHPLLPLLLLLGMASALTAHGSGKGMALYWGWHVNNITAAGLELACKTGHFDQVNIAFLTDFGYGKPPRPDFGTGCDAPSGGCKYLQSEIEYCQSVNVKVLLSIGGFDATYRLPNEEEAHRLAAYVYNVYLSGYGVDGPLGKVKLDGVDFWINDTLSTAYWDVVAVDLKRYDEMLILTGSQACNHSLGVPDIPIYYALKTGLFSRVWARVFGDHYPCVYERGNTASFESAVRNWTTDFEGYVGDFRIAVDCHPKYIRGFIPPEEIEGALDIVRKYPTYSGVAVWNRHWDLKYMEDGYANGPYSETIYPHVQDSLEPDDDDAARHNHLHEVVF